MFLGYKYAKNTFEAGATQLRELTAFPKTLLLDLSEPLRGEGRGTGKVKKAKESKGGEKTPPIKCLITYVLGRIVLWEYPDHAFSRSHDCKLYCVDECVCAFAVFGLCRRLRGVVVSPTVTMLS